MNKETCKICGNTAGNKTWTVKEMMFGLQDPFHYLECASCKCLQLMDIPADLSPYYPQDYYSYYSKGEEHHIQTSFSKSLKRAMKGQLLDYYLQGDSWVGKKMTPKFSSYYPWIKKNMLTTQSAILDVGCGSGELLLKMYNDGFRNLAGLDPFIKEEINYSCGITIHKKDLQDLQSRFDLIMMHHAFEHMDHPRIVLERIASLLNPGGLALIRIPVADCYAWRTYGVDWVQLDAPRHIFLHTQQSMQLLSDQAGFRLGDVVYDSWSLQFTGSEKYRRGIPLRSGDDLFTPEQIAAYNQQAQKLNEAKDGDQACFYLYKK